MSRTNNIMNYPNLSLSEIKSLTAQKKPNLDNYNSLITPYNGDNKWEEGCKQMWWGKDYAGEIEEKCKPVIRLRDKLLSIGGVEACMPAIEEDLDNIMKYGQLWDNITTKLIRGRQSKCHMNSAELWYNNRNSYKDGHIAVICTGYALSYDGFWRQHSWIIHCKQRVNNIIETTEKRVAYYGFAMTYDIAKDFEYWNS